MIAIDLATIDRLTNGRLGAHDVGCPLCGPYKSRQGQRRKVLRIWRIEPGFAGFHCARCGEQGYARERTARIVDPQKLEEARREAAERQRIHEVDRLAKARWLWSRRQPTAGTAVERYLRNRGYSARIPATIGLLPAFRGHPPTMIAAFGLAHETEPGVIRISDDAVTGIHLTRLLPDGSDRERGNDAKIMIGHSAGSPIVLAPPNDLLGLAIGEGLEKVLAVHEATGLGAWVAGSAARLPALVDAVPSYIECVTVMIDDDKDGRRHAETLMSRLRARCIEVRGVIPNLWVRAAA
jgi:hypothetical protein